MNWSCCIRRAARLRENGRTLSYAAHVIADVFAGITALSTVATAAAVGIGVGQLRASKEQLELAREQAQTSFEDDLAREYREIIGQLPAGAFYIDGAIELDDDALRWLYRYFDLSNEQLAMVRQDKRISAEMAEQWKEGIRGNLALPVFRSAWGEISPHLPHNFFEDLREFVPEPAEDDRQE